MEEKKMPDLSVSQEDGRVVMRLDPDTEFTVGDVSRFTGYTVQFLQREDGKKIPASRRDEKGRRVWFASDLITIREVRVRNMAKMRRHGGPEGNGG
jgi:uncharacterized Zn finger protein